MSVVADKRRGPGRPKVNKPKDREGVSYHIFLKDAVAEAFERSREDAVRNKKDHFGVIVEEWLRLKGYLGGNKS